MIANTISHETSSERDEAPFLRCALLSELVTRDATVQRMTQLPTRCAVDLAAKKSVPAGHRLRGWVSSWTNPAGRCRSELPDDEQQCFPPPQLQAACSQDVGVDHCCGSHPDANVLDATSWPLLLRSHPRSSGICGFYVLWSARACSATTIQPTALPRPQHPGPKKSKSLPPPPRR